MSEIVKNTDATISTYTGGIFHVLNPDVDEINIVDIAHALSFQPRFAGHTNEFYSVGDHSNILTRLFMLRDQSELAKYALLHDAAEAYVLDMPHAVKYMSAMVEYKKLEKSIQRRIFEKFGLEVKSEWLHGEPDEVKTLDSRLAHNEARDLLKRKPWWYDGRKLIQNVFITPTPFKTTERTFMTLFGQLFGEYGTPRG